MNEQFQPPKGTPLFNPWTPEFIADPYPFYHRLRVTDPMHLTPLRTGADKRATRQMATHCPRRCAKPEIVSSSPISVFRKHSHPKIGLFRPMFLPRLSENRWTHLSCSREGGHGPSPDEGVLLDASPTTRPSVFPTSSPSGEPFVAMCDGLIVRRDRNVLSCISGRCFLAHRRNDAYSQF
jgi:hypothetical protein